MPKETLYYDLLGVPANATPEEIKRSYRRLALQYHPDKCPGGEEQFKNINMAWEVLGDEKLKGVYDQYGQMGVDMAKQFGDSFQYFMGPQANSMAMTFFSLASLLIALLALFPIFVSLRADETVLWNWAVVFVPVWIVDGFLLLFVIGRYFLWSPPADENEEMEQEEEFTPEERARLRQERERLQKAMDFVLGAKYLLQWAAFVLFQAFIVCKLNESVSWTWATVFLPWWGWEALQAITLGSQFVFLVSSKNSPLLSSDSLDVAGLLRLKWSQKLLIAWSLFRSWLFRIVLSILIVLRADLVFTSSWAVVFLPVYLLYGWWLVEPILQYFALGKLMHGEQRSAFMTMFVVKEIALVLGGTLFFVMLGLFIARLDGSSTVSVVSLFIPVFVVLGLLFCCCCCCLPCLTMAGSLVDEESHPYGVPLPLSVKRITYGSSEQETSSVALEVSSAKQKENGGASSHRTE